MCRCLTASRWCDINLRLNTALATWRDAAADAAAASLTRSAHVIVPGLEHGLNTLLVALGALLVALGTLLVALVNLLGTLLATMDNLLGVLVTAILNYLAAVALFVDFLTWPLRVVLTAIFRPPPHPYLRSVAVVATHELIRQGLLGGGRDARLKDRITLFVRGPAGRRFFRGNLERQFYLWYAIYAGLLWMMQRGLLLALEQVTDGYLGGWMFYEVFFGVAWLVFRKGVLEQGQPVPIPRGEGTSRKKRKARGGKKH